MIEAQRAVCEQGMANVMATVLNKAYPGHLWAVNVDIAGGVVHIRNLFLSGRWGFVVKLADVQDDVENKQLMRAAGELLERYRLRRGAMNDAEYMGLNTDFAGNPIADH
jgi:hypothetical protein